MWSMTKKRSSEILADENREIFREKVKFRNFSTESENFSKIGGNLKQGGNASWPQGGWTHLPPSFQIRTHDPQILNQIDASVNSSCKRIRDGGDADNKPVSCGSLSSFRAKPPSRRCRKATGHVYLPSNGRSHLVTGEISLIVIEKLLPFQGAVSD